MLERVVNRLTRIIKDAAYALSARPSDLDITPERLRGPSQDYQKFVVLAHARSGSSMLIDALRRHPQVISFGEIFERRRIGFNVDGYDNESVKLLYLRNRYPVEFLERAIFSSYREDISAVGFKLFPDQLSSKRLDAVWKWLCSDRSIKAILLQRRNLLATYTSLLIARKTGTFGITSESQRTSVTVTIDFRECLDEFVKRKEYHEDVMRRFRKHDILEVSYEDMAKDLSGYFREFQEFLGVDSYPPWIGSIKKEIRPLSEVITNYQSLRRRFSGTEWGYLFEDEANRICGHSLAGKLLNGRIEN